MSGDRATAAFFDSLLESAKAAAPLIGHGLPQAIILGEKLIDTIDKAKAMAKGEIPPPLDGARDALEEKVRDHVKRTAANLRG